MQGASKTYIAIVVVILGLCVTLNPGSWAQSGASPAPSSRTLSADSSGPGVKAEEHAISQSALEVVRVFGFPITNSIIVTWVVASGLIVFARVATRQMKPVPTGAQNFWEWLVGGLQSFLESVMGKHLVDRTFWFFATIFIFIWRRTG